MMHYKGVSLMVVWDENIHKQYLCCGVYVENVTLQKTNCSSFSVS